MACFGMANLKSSYHPNTLKSIFPPVEVTTFHPNNHQEADSHPKSKSWPLKTLAQSKSCQVKKLQRLVSHSDFDHSVCPRPSGFKCCYGQQLFVQIQNPLSPELTTGFAAP